MKQIPKGTESDESSTAKYWRIWWVGKCDSVSKEEEARSGFSMPDPALPRASPGPRGGRKSWLLSAKRGEGTFDQGSGPWSLGRLPSPPYAAAQLMVPHLESQFRKSVEELTSCTRVPRRERDQ